MTSPSGLSEASPPPPPKQGHPPPTRMFFKADCWPLAPSHCPLVSALPPPVCLPDSQSSASLTSASNSPALSLSPPPEPGGPPSASNSPALSLSPPPEPGGPPSATNSLALSLSPPPEPGGPPSATNSLALSLSPPPEPGAPAKATSESEDTRLSTSSTSPSSTSTSSTSAAARDSPRPRKRKRKVRYDPPAASSRRRLVKRLFSFLTKSEVCAVTVPQGPQRRLKGNRRRLWGGDEQSNGRGRTTPRRTRRSVCGALEVYACPPPPPRASLEYLKTKGGGSPKTPSPPPQTKVTIVGKNEIYNRENLVRPFLVHQVLGPKPPPPLPPPAQKKPCPPPPPRLKSLHLETFLYGFPVPPQCLVPTSVRESTLLLLALGPVLSSCPV